MKYLLLILRNVCEMPAFAQVPISVSKDTRGLQYKELIARNTIGFPFQAETCETYHIAHRVITVTGS